MRATRYRQRPLLQDVAQQLLCCARNDLLYAPLTRMDTPPPRHLHLPFGVSLPSLLRKTTVLHYTFIFCLLKSIKFDDLCAEFGHHEDLDGTGAVLTVDVDNVSGEISSVSLSASGTAGLIPLTVPSSITVGPREES